MALPSSGARYIVSRSSTAFCIAYSCSAVMYLLWMASSPTGASSCAVRKFRHFSLPFQGVLLVSSVATPPLEPPSASPPLVPGAKFTPLVGCTSLAAGGGGRISVAAAASSNAVAALAAAPVALLGLVT